MKYNHHHIMDIMYQEYVNGIEENEIVENITSKQPESADEVKIQNVVNKDETISYWLQEQGYSKEAGKSAYLSNLVYTDEESKPVGFTKDEELSIYNKEGLVSGNVYLDNENNDVYLVFKGTNPLSLEDLQVDANILVGSEELTNRFRQGDQQFKKVREKYGENRLFLAGHSMAGTISSRLGTNYKVDHVYTFNRGSVPTSEIPRSAQKSKSRQTHFRIDGDLISLGDKVTKKREKTETLKSRMGNDPLSAHKMDNFLYITPKKDSDGNFIVEKTKNQLKNEAGDVIFDIVDEIVGGIGIFV